MRLPPYNSATYWMLERRMRSVRLHEREICARIAEQKAVGSTDFVQFAKSIARAIREREGKKEEP